MAKNKSCEYCGETVQGAIRSTKKYCSDACRVMYSQHGCSKLIYQARAITGAFSELIGILEMSDSDYARANKAQFLECLSNIRTDVNEAKSFIKRDTSHD